jgi:hypothetical protein
VTRRTIPITVPMSRAAGVLPRQVLVGEAALDIDHEGETITTGRGRGVRYKARWTKATGSGTGYVDIIQNSKMSGEIGVSLNSPAGVRRVLWSGARLRGLAELFAHALRYSVETRASEQADGFEVWRTRADLVKARAT